MKSIIVTASLLIALLQITFAQTGVKQYTIEQFYKTTSYGGGNFNKGENKILIHDNSSGIFNVYELDLATKQKKQLTNSANESHFMLS